MQILRVVYLFAGHQRKSDVKSHLQTLFGSQLHMREFDIIGSPTHDILDDACWRSIFAEIREFKPHVILATPPCNTFSRARRSHRSQWGPPPIRDFVHPLGFPWLSNANKYKADCGNVFVDRTWDLFEFAVDNSIRFLGEHPEDLGTASTGRPASIWQSERFQALLLRPNVRTFAFFQCEFGGETSKPTRFVTDLDFESSALHFGPPNIDATGQYHGPLPLSCPHGRNHPQLIGTTTDGTWRTSPSAHYPNQLCELIALAISSTFGSSHLAPPASLGLDAVGAGEQDPLSRCDPSSAEGDGLLCVPSGAGQQGPLSRHDPSSTLVQRMRKCLEDLAGVVLVDEPLNQEVKTDLHFSELVSGCIGPPLKASFSGKCSHFVDGFGRCSPGRWTPHARGATWSKSARELSDKLRAMLDRFCCSNLVDLARASFMLATGKMKASPFSAEAIQKLREEWANLLPSPQDALKVPPFQPFFLHALSQTMRILEDPDWEILDSSRGGNFAEGVPVGHRSPLTWVPQVFGHPIKSPSYDETSLQLSMENYRSGPEAAQILQAQYQEEEQEGRMFPLSMAEAQRRYQGPDLRIAAQGILEKPGGGYRIIHDATHGVNVNNQITICNRLENPGPREISTIMKVSEEAQERVIFGITGDIAKAHRRFVHSEQDWGVLACKTCTASPTVWLNRTGTFGVASASYWWSRLAGLLGRLVLRVTDRDWLFALLYVDDLHLAAGGANRWLSIWRVLACLEMVGVPFSYKKFGGGFTLDYVGYWLDYSKFALGISEKRVLWMVKFLTDANAAKWLIDVRRFHEAHGRLGFMAQVLPWIRPFLAPGYQWLAAVRKGGVLQAPLILQRCCEFIRLKLQLGCRTTPCRLPEIQLGEVFRTDAKCDCDRVVLGGWSLSSGTDPKGARWFSLSLNKQQVPWLFKEGKGSQHCS